jgi:LysM repeat protein
MSRFPTMTKSPAPSATAPRLCPTCGTRVGAAATKCLVCGADLTVKNGAAAGGRPRPQAKATVLAPERRTVSPWLILALLVLVGAAVGVAVWLNSDLIKLPNFFGGAPSVTQATPTVAAAPSSTLQPTFTPQPTATETLAPSETPLPPQEYTVAPLDTCLKIAADFEVSFQSIIQLNALDPNCTLSVGQVLLIPQPTLTPSPQPTATLNANIMTAIPRATYTVHAGDTLQGIANFYGVTVADLMEVNGITDALSIRPDQVLIIPLERRITPGPTPTATPPPPWPAPNQLLPADGQTFSAAEVVTLQWTSVGTLRPGEYYYVEVEDVTCNCAAFRRWPTTETKWIVPDDFRPADGKVHIYRWTVTTVRQRPDTDAAPVYDPAGTTSPHRVFSWTGGAAP